MPIAFNCPNCGKQYCVKAELVGKSVICKACKKQLTIQTNDHSTAKFVGLYGGNRDHLIKVARYQKGILVCILVQMILYGCYVNTSAVIQTILGLSLIVALLVGTVFVYLLVSEIESTTSGVCLAISTLIPYLGFLILLFVINTASKTLKKNGIRVGLLGADVSQI